MALVALPGEALVQIGPGYSLQSAGAPGSGSSIAAAALSSVVAIGHVATSDGASHTIDTTGSSSLGWLTGAITFASSSTTVKVGLAAVDATAGPPARAVNVTNTITLDVSKSLIGGGGGITTSAWQTHVPDAGTKTIANGDLVAFCMQMTARGGTDSVSMAWVNNAEFQRPSLTAFSGSYSAASAVPNAIITFADGALGYFYNGEVFASLASRGVNSSSSPNEYGQLFNLPFPLKIYGLYGWVSATAGANNFDMVLYSAPLSGSPVAEKTVSVDSNQITSVSARKITTFFASPYTYSANTDMAVVLKPTTTSNITAYYKTLASAQHRIVDPFGTSGYGVSRASGAFANVNSSLDHYYVGLLAGAFDVGGVAGRSVQINADSVVG